MKKRVFILGAGASRPYRFPTGKELRREICFDFPEQYKIFLSKTSLTPAKQEAYNSIAENFKDTFYKSSMKSIDLFLINNPQFKKIGKEAILFRILHAEANSKFREDVEDESKDWYMLLFDYIKSYLINLETRQKNDISFITFNYDRSLEYFLYESVTNAYTNLVGIDIENELRKMKFLHVYGQIGKLEWQRCKKEELPYGYNIDNINIQNYTDQIRIIHDERLGSVIEEAKKLISDADEIYFLGFGFAPENLGILGIPEILESNKKNRKIYATTKNFTDKERAQTIAIFNKSLQDGTSFDTHTDFGNEKWDCKRLLREYPIKIE